MATLSYGPATLLSAQPGNCSHELSGSSERMRLLSGIGRTLFSMLSRWNQQRLTFQNPSWNEFRNCLPSFAFPLKDPSPQVAFGKFVVYFLDHTIVCKRDLQWRCLRPPPQTLPMLHCLWQSFLGNCPAFAHWGWEQDTGDENSSLKTLGQNNLRPAWTPYQPHNGPGLILQNTQKCQCQIAINLYATVIGSFNGSIWFQQSRQIAKSVASFWLWPAGPLGLLVSCLRCLACQFLKAMIATWNFAKLNMLAKLEKSNMKVKYGQGCGWKCLVHSRTLRAMPSKQNCCP